MPAQEIVPTAITQDQLDELCQLIVGEMSVRSACKELGIARCTFYFWMDKHATDEQLDQYSRALWLRQDALLDETIDIADDSSLDYRFVARDDESGQSAKAVVDHEHVTRSKIRIETRFKMAEKMHPRKYGARLQTELTGKDGGPVEMTSADHAIIAQTLALLKKDG